MSWCRRRYGAFLAHRVFPLPSILCTSSRMPCLRGLSAQFDPRLLRWDQLRVDKPIGELNPIKIPNHGNEKYGAKHPSLYCLALTCDYLFLTTSLYPNSTISRCTNGLGEGPVQIVIFEPIVQFLSVFFLSSTLSDLRFEPLTFYDSYTGTYRTFLHHAS